MYRIDVAGSIHMETHTQIWRCVCCLQRKSTALVGVIRLHLLRLCNIGSGYPHWRRGICPPLRRTPPVARIQHTTNCLCNTMHDILNNAHSDVLQPQRLRLASPEAHCRGTPAIIGVNANRFKKNFQDCPNYVPPCQHTAPDSLD